MTRNSLCSRGSLAVAVLIVGVSFAPICWADEPHDMITDNPSTAKFGPSPDLPSCASIAALRGDPSKGAATLLAKMAAGCRIPWHWHTATEDVIFVSGSGKLEMKDGKAVDLAPGTYASLPAKHAHQATFATDSTLFIVTDGPFDIHYIDAAGKEISIDSALKDQAAKTH